MILETLNPKNRITEAQLGRIHTLSLRFGKRSWPKVKTALGYGDVRVNMLTQEEATDFEDRLRLTLGHRQKTYRQRQVWDVIPDEAKAPTEKRTVLAY